MTWQWVVLILGVLTFVLGIVAVAAFAPKRDR